MPAGRLPHYLLGRQYPDAPPAFRAFRFCVAAASISCLTGSKMPKNGRGENEPGREGLSLAGVQSNSASGEKRVFHNPGKGTLIAQEVDRLDRLASLGTLSAGLAHEIKNALVGVTTFINLLLEKNQDAQLAEIVR